MVVYNSYNEGQQRAPIDISLHNFYTIHTHIRFFYHPHCNADTERDNELICYMVQDNKSSRGMIWTTYY